MSSFKADAFVAECKSALEDPSVQKSVRAVVERAVSDAGPVIRALGEPNRAGVQTLLRSDELTILNVTWAPYMTLLPHNHQMWAVIGVYTGREDNIFWRRVKDSPGRIEAAGARSLSSKDATPLGHDIIHSVTNPIPRLTGAIHVYGGDFFAEPRSEWNPETLMERPYDIEQQLAFFEAANAGLPGDD